MPEPKSRAQKPIPKADHRVIAQRARSTIERAGTAPLAHRDH
jgi:hypothetical protein